MHRQRFITNTVFLFGTGMVAQVVGLLVLPLFIRNLGEEMYGLFVISNMLMGYVGLLDFGFTDGLTRQIGRAHASGDRQSVSDAVSTGFWLLVGVGLLAGLLIYFGRFVFLDFLNVTGPDRGVGADLLTVTAVFSMLQWPMRLPQAILKATLHIKQFSIVQASFAVVASFAMLALVLLSFDVVGIRLGVCLVLAASWVPQVLLVRRCLPDLAWNPFRFRREAFLGMSGFSLGMFYTRVLSLLSSRVDHLIIGAMISVGTIPAYVVAEAWRRLTVRATGNLFGAVMPTVFSLDTDANRKKLQTLLDGAVRYRALLISPLAHLGIVMSPAFIKTWMGAEYAPYAIWSQLFMVPVLTTVFGVATNIARGIGKLKICNSILTVRVILNVTLSIALIPVFGVGAPILGTIPKIEFRFEPAPRGRLRRGLIVTIVGGILIGALIGWFIFGAGDGEEGEESAAVLSAEGGERWL